MTDDQKLLKHLHHPLYKQALNEFAAKQQTQIKKGAQKYDEPLNPDSWTHDQLIDHADEEIVDLKHYLTTLRNKGWQMEEDLQFMALVIELHRDSIGYADGSVIDRLVKKYKRTPK